MPSQGSDSPSVESSAARTYTRLWSERAKLLDAERLRALRALSESEAARRFARLMHGLPTASRPTSGLVEQQRIFSRLRKTPA